MRTLRQFIGLRLCFAIAVLSGYTQAQPQEIGFSEKFALSENREALLGELIPGADNYFYYHCLHCQTVGKIAEARVHLDAWIAKFGLTEQSIRMQTRQYLLEYKTNSQATLDYLRAELGINIDHTPPRKNEAAELPTSLDNKLLDWKTRLRIYASNPGAIENVALPYLAALLEQSTTIRAWLQRIDRIDTPGLLEIIANELAMPDSRGFGWSPIHNMLTIEQLLELQKRFPKLLESYAYVQARLRRIRPSDDASLDNRSVLREHLTALEGFVTSLPESQNSLLANVLYHRLRFDEQDGNMDRERFLRYIRLPSHRPFLHADFIASQSGRPQINTGANYKGETQLEIIGDDTPMVHRYLEHFFKSDANVDAFSSIIDRDTLRRIFASTKILYGIGDAKTFYAQLSPDEQRELQSRIELKFAITNPTFYNPNDKVRLTLDLKNVPELLVKVYRLNARNILENQKQPIGTDIDLDGLIANKEKRLTYAQPADIRHREVIEMPEMEGGGVWVVDLLASGQRSRTLVHKGQLHAVQRMSDVGDTFRIFDADGKHVPTAKIVFGDREFSADEQGDIVIPFGKEVKQDSMVIVDGPIASVQLFVHNKENYTLQAGFLVDPQSLLAGAKATLAIRPILTCNGQLVSLKHLDKPMLTITSTDHDGISTTQALPELKLADNGEWTHSFLVPQRLSTIAFTLSGQVLKLSDETRVPVSSSRSVVLNGATKTAQTQDFFWTQTEQDNLLEVRGRNGEPSPRIAVQLEFKLFGIQPTMSVRLATDENGIINLGQLPNVERFKASADSIQPRDFVLAADTANWPPTCHALAGQTVEVVWNTTDRAEQSPLKISPNNAPLSRLSILEFRGGSVVAIHSDKISVERGLVKIKGLAPGTYRLTDHWSGRTMQIDLVQGEQQADSLIGQSKILDLNRVRSVHIQEVKASNDKLEIQIGNHDAFTRIHVVASAYETNANLGQSLPSAEFPITSSARTKIPAFYINSLKLDEEYQYVLQRQFLKKYIGNLLPQPSAILNPWELAVTQNTSQSAQTGDPMASMAPKMEAAAGGAPGGMANRKVATDNSPEYEFLKRGSAMLINAHCDDQGKFSLDRKALDGLTSITVIVVHPTGSTYRKVHLPLSKPRELVDRSLAKAFAASDRLAEIQTIRVLPKSDKIDLGDAASTRVKIYSSVPDVFELYRTLLNNHPHVDKFNCLTRWPSLSEEDKARHYADLACHELHLFLKLHDPKFFDRVVRPYLANKMQKQFMDDFVLDLDLSKHIQPWKLAQLNAVERVLLAKRVAAQSGSTKRWMGDLVRSAPVNSAAQSILFSKGLMSSALWGMDTNTDGLLALGLEFRDSGVLDSKDASKNHVDAFFDSESPAKESLGEEDAKPRGSKQAGDKQAESKKVSDQPANRPESLGRSLKLKRGGTNGLAAPPRLYQSLESTRKWAESNYYRLALPNQNGDLVRPNLFWLDYLNHADDKPFLSKHLELAASNFHEAILALAVLGLPLESKPATMSVEQNRLLAATYNDAIAFVQGLESMEQSLEPATILASQGIYLASDSAEAAKPVKEQSLVKGTVYRLRVVLTNPSSTIVRVNVLQQIPQGAIALENAKVVTGQKLDLAPFATQEINTKFYFPAAGQLEHYGAQISINDKIAIAVPSNKLTVLDAPESVDETSWPFVASWGTDDQVFEYLKNANLFKTNLDAIAWRMANKGFYETCLARLSEYGISNPTLWAYALKHNDAPRLREFLENNLTLIRRVGPSFISELINVEPVDRLLYEHLDFRPLMVARSHQLGPKRVILNDGLAVQYEQWMGILSHQRGLDAEQRLALVYYLILQNRTEEAIAHFQKIDASRLESKLQYDYFAAYLDVTQGKFEEANMRALKYVDLPLDAGETGSHKCALKSRNERQSKLVSRRTLSKQKNGKPIRPNRLLSGSREQQNLDEAAKLPALEPIQDGEKIVFRHRNLDSIQVRYFLMDIELLFSRSPFAQQDGGRLNIIEPNSVDTIQLEKSADGKVHELVVPEKLRNKNVVIEFAGGGLTKRIVQYANSLVVNHSPNLGRLQVLTKQGFQPLEGAYVKVYARDSSGAVKFYKDGYTDLRGQFDYVSLSTNELEQTQRFAFLVLHPEHGTVVRESDPPKR